MNSENCKTSKPHVLILNLTDKIPLLYQILVFTIHRKTLKNHATTINVKYELQHGMMNMN